MRRREMSKHRRRAKKRGEEDGRSEKTNTRDEKDPDKEKTWIR